MTIWNLLGSVCAAGAVGGLVNAYLTDNGFALPKREKVGKVSILRPGIFGNMFASAVAAGVSWGLYGPLATYNLYDSATTPDISDLVLTLATLVGAVLVGMTGAKWLTGEAEKNLLKASVVKATSSTSDASKAQAMALASPVQVAALADSL